MRALHVVPLEEGLEDDLPVRREDGGQVGAKAQLLEVVRAEQRGQRIEVLEQRWRLAIEAHEHEAAPRVDAHPVEAETLGNVRELVGIHDLDESPVERVPPRVVRAPDVAAVGARLEVPAAGRKSRPAVQARVEHRVQITVLAPDHEHGLVTDRVLQVVAGRRDLLLAAGDLPDARPHLIELGVEELRREVALLRDGPVVAKEPGRGVGCAHGGSFASLEFNLADLFEAVADAVPERCAVVHGDRRQTYTDLEARANRCAHALAALGVEHGDHVGLYLRSCPEFLEAMLGCFKLRAVPINLNDRYVAAEVLPVAVDADLRGVVMGVGLPTQPDELRAPRPLGGRAGRRLRAAPGGGGAGP